MSRSDEGMCWQGEVLKQEMKMIDVAGPCHTGGGFKRGEGCSVFLLESSKSQFVLSAGRKPGSPDSVKRGHPSRCVAFYSRLGSAAAFPVTEWKEPEFVGKRLSEPAPRSRAVAKRVGAASGEDDGLSAPPRVVGPLLNLIGSDKGGGCRLLAKLDGRQRVQTWVRTFDFKRPRLHFFCFTK